MNITSSRKVLKAVGILTTIGAALMLLLGTLISAGAKAVTPEMMANSGIDAAVLPAAAGIIFLAGILSFIEGVIEIKASKDSRYGKAAWVFGIVGVLLVIGNIVSQAVSGSFSASAIVTLGSGLVMNGLVIAAAGEVRKADRNGGFVEAVQ